MLQAAMVADMTANEHGARRRTARIKLWATTICVLILAAVAWRSWRNSVYAPTNVDRFLMLAHPTHTRNNLHAVWLSGEKRTTSALPPELLLLAEIPRNARPGEMVDVSAVAPKGSDIPPEAEEISSLRLTDLQTVTPSSGSTSGQMQEVTLGERIGQDYIVHGGRGHPRPWASVRREDERHCVMTIFYSVYRIGEKQNAEMLFTASYESGPYMWPQLTDVPVGDAPPDIVVFNPPLGVACWRWNGSKYRVSLPLWRDIRPLLKVVAGGMALLPVLLVIIVVPCLIVLLIVYLIRSRSRRKKSETYT